MDQRTCNHLFLHNISGNKWNEAFLIPIRVPDWKVYSARGRNPLCILDTREAFI